VDDPRDGAPLASGRCLRDLAADLPGWVLRCVDVRVGTVAEQRPDDGGRSLARPCDAGRAGRAQRDRNRGALAGPGEVDVRGDGVSGQSSECELPSERPAAVAVLRQGGREEAGRTPAYAGRLRHLLAHVQRRLEGCLLGCHAGAERQPSNRQSRCHHGGREYVLTLHSNSSCFVCLRCLRIVL